MDYPASSVVEPDLAELELLTIGAMARECGVTVRTLRYYEEMDLIGPIRRTTGKYRLYNQRMVKRVKAISALQELNFTLEEILTTLGGYSQSLQFSKSQQIQATRQSLQLQKNVIDHKLEDLKQLVADIEGRLKVIETLCEPCVSSDPNQHCADYCAHRDVHVS